jgi:hypothetical protein
MVEVKGVEPLANFVFQSGDSLPALAMASTSAATASVTTSA